MASNHRVSATPSVVYEESAPGGAEWMTCLRETCELLWPSPAVVTLEGRQPGSGGRESSQDQVHATALPVTSEFVLVPGVRRPPLLVPASRRGAAAAVRLYGGPSSPLARLGVRALTVGLASGLGGAMLRGRIRVRAPARADTIETYLKNVVSADIRVSMYLGPARANRKPILQVLTTGGEPVGFAKIGTNPLTRRLVRAERDSLTRLRRAGLSEIKVPLVLHHGRWHDLDVLVLSALPAWRHRRPLPEVRLTSAMTEVSQVGGHQHGPLPGSAYLRQLRSRLAAAGEGAEQAALLHAIDRVTARAGDTVFGYGAWHGDWAPWNMANTGSGLLVWDWERFTCGVPLGFDALHYRLHAEAGPGRYDARSAAARCPAQAARLLTPFGIGARQARITAILYLTDLAVRYLADGQAQAGARRGAPGTWLVPAIMDETARL